MQNSLAYPGRWGVVSRPERFVAAPGHQLYQPARLELSNSKVVHMVTACLAFTTQASSAWLSLLMNVRCLFIAFERVA